jgi:hypothetical protein
VPRLALVALVLCASGLASAGPTAAAGTLPGFRSPSGTISCVALPRPHSDLLCHVERPDFAQQLQHRCIARDSLDWHGFRLTPTGKGTIVCAGGILWTERPVYVVVPYGTTWRHGSYACASRITGITCRNGRGHGLFLSRQTWRGW